MPHLIVEKGADKGKSAELSESDPLVVGRSPDADFTINELMISREHFRIESRNGSFVIRDLDSVHGTFVEGHEIEEAELDFGDQIRVGETLFSFLSEETREERKDLIGETIGGYKIQERIGRGGMGTVYKARQVRLNRIVAFKILSKELVRDKKFVELFIREARSAARLNHPNIVQVYDVARKRGLYYISMEYVPGGSVQDLLSSKGKIEPVRAAEMIQDAARGLQYAEKKELVHRDIKPDNLMIDEDENIKIIDLGLAKKIREKEIKEDEQSKEGNGDTGDGTVFGTPHYMPPERVLKKEMDVRGDIYSLGATFYRMIVGDTAFGGSSIKEILRKKVNQPPPNPSDQLEEIPEWISDVIIKMMQPKPEDRYGSASEVISEIESGLQKESGIHTSVEREERTYDERILVAAGGVILALMIAAGAILAFNRPWEGNNNSRLTAEPTGTDRNSEDPSTNPPANPANETPLFNSIMDMYEKARASSDLGTVNNSIKNHRLFLKTFPDSDKYDQVESQLNRLEKRRTTLLFKQEFSELENKIKSTKNSLKQASVTTPAEIDDLKQQINQQVNSLLSKLKSTEDETSHGNIKEIIRSEREQLESWKSQLTETLTDFRGEIRLLRSEIDNDNFESAYLRLNRLTSSSRFTGTPYEQSLTKLSEHLKNKQRKFYRNAERNIQTHLSKNQFEQAKNAARSLLRAVVSDDLTARSRDLLKTVRKEKEQYIARQREEERKQERIKLLREGAEFLTRVNSRTLNWRFNYFENVSKPKYTANSLIYNLLKFLSREHNRFYRYLIKNQESLNRATIPHPNKKNRLVQVKKLSSDNITVQMNVEKTNRKTPVTLSWSAFNMEEIIGLGANNWTPFTYRDHIHTAVMYFLYAHRFSGFTDEAIAYVNDGFKIAESKREISISPVEQTFKKLLHGQFATFQEGIARGLHLNARTNLNDGQKTLARNNLILLSQRYGTTRWVQDHITEIKSLRQNANLSPQVNPKNPNWRKSASLVKTLREWNRVMEPVQKRFEDNSIPRIKRVVKQLKKENRYRELGLIHFNLGKYRKACDFFSKLLSSENNVSLKTLFKHYRAALLAERPPEEQQKLLDMIRARVQGPGQKKRVSRLFKRWKQQLSSIDRTERQMMETFLLNPRVPEVLIRMIKDLYNRKLPNARKRYLLAEYIIQNFPEHRFARNGTAYYIAADSLFRIGDYREALSHYKALQKVNPDHGVFKSPPGQPDPISKCKRAIKNFNLQSH